MAILCNGQKLPLKLSFYFRPNKEEEVTQVWKPNSMNGQKNFITIKENWYVGIKFYCENKEDYCDEARVSLQTSLYDQDDNQQKLTYSLSNKDEIKWIYNKDISKDTVYPWRMGSYFIDIEYRGERFSTGFIVLPTHLTVEQIYTIHNFLESKSEGIIYDLIYSTPSLSKVIEEPTSNQWVYDYARLMEDVKDKILYSLYEIDKSPSTQLENVYKISPKQGRLGIKSVKWECRGKSSFKNKNKCESVNTPPNQWLVHILQKWKNRISEVKKILLKNHVMLEDELIRISDEIEEINVKKVKLKTHSNAAKSTFYHYENLLTKYTKNIKKNESLYLQHEKWINTLELLEGKMGFMLTKSFLKYTERGFRRPFLKRNSYVNIDSMYEESYKIRKDDGYQKRMLKILKPTWHIYEYYCLFKTLDSIKCLGYRLVDGIGLSFLNLFQENNVPEGHRFVFENENSIIHVWYDKYHAHTEKEAIEKEEYFFTHQNKKRPDIKIDVFKKDEERGLLFKDSVVIDAKFRKLSSIYSQNYVKEAHSQLSAYHSFFYCGDNRLSNSYGTAVNRVICLHASGNEDKPRQILRPITYINLFPYLEQGGEELVNNSINDMGAEELREELKEWLSELTIESNFV
ncbi:hypothetical protein [Alteribacter keqinensis]|uniref:DUF2357 domain-containing protein n=1 Tax=Alteribacter keqinensis TaxID=2483800 RepID=A0A3M7TU95_9BACI|nr:hypothetical protein [Alteribacter keqinensis]RNA68552.1 hypothetical protein EBO34_00845 [Alteribacter keqinensis]